MEDNSMSGNWIEWHGGDCPIKSDDTLGDVKFRSGEIWLTTILKYWNWSKGKGGGDIIAYRITEDHEPKETPVIDLTTNTSAYGLCSDEWRDAMDSHISAGGEVETYGHGKWHRKSTTPLSRLFFMDECVYRAKPGPVVTVETFPTTFPATIGQQQAVGEMTVTLHDGKPVRAEWVAKDEVKP